MADTIRRRMSLEEFLAWEERQEGRHEFVGGRIRAMVGGTRRHNMVAGNIFAFLHGRLRGTPCRAFLADTKAASPGGNVRYPDVIVDCGKARPTDLIASEPTVVVEVLSKSTAFLDQSQKLDEYQSISTMRHILHLAQERAEGELWSRTDSGWRRQPLSGLNAEVRLDAIGVTFALAVAYEDVELDPEPQNDNGEAQA